MVKFLSHYRKVKAISILEFFETDRFLPEELKLKLSKEYFRRLRKVLKSKLNGGNLVQGVNTWEASLLRYQAEFISWRKCELRILGDRKIRKLFTIY